jgi:putative spermidine/putrescine transport system substrate-binding protein
MKRRSFLIGGGMLALAPGLAACGVQGENRLQIQFLKGSIPNQVIEEFPRGAGAVVNFEPKVVEQLKEVWENLQTFQQPPAPSNWDWLPFRQNSSAQPPDLLTLGDSWLQEAIAQKLIAPLPVAEIPLWSKLPRRWQDLVRRNSQGIPATDGQVWGAPYRWGTTMIAYDVDRFAELGWVPQDWSDLWKPELRGKISLLDQPREVIGLTLKKLGHSYNHQELSKIPDLKSELGALHQQAKLYSNDRYLQPLILGDTWAAVGWSTDLLPLLKRNPRLTAVIPKSGTALWADLWVHPQGRDLSAGAKSWINFCWEATTANRLSLLSNGTSPMITGMNPQEIFPDLLTNPLILPPGEVVNNSDFLEPLTTTAAAEYLALWQEIRTAKK